MHRAEVLNPSGCRLLKAIPSRQISIALLAGSIYHKKQSQSWINKIDYHPFIYIVPDSALLVLQSMNLKRTDLPTFALFKSNAHHSAREWLAYQASLLEVRLLSFNSDGSIKEVFIIDIPPEPLQSIRLAYDEKISTIYVGLAFHTKFMVLQKNQLITQFVLPLNCNIVDFEGGFVSVEGVSDQHQVYFVFITANGRIVTQPVSNVQNRAIIDISLGKERVTSLCAEKGWGYIGLESGAVLKIDLNTRKTISKYLTKSELPIINMRLGRDILALGTCDGEIHVLNFNLQVFGVVTAHAGMVVLLHIDQNRIYSVGDDGILRVWAFENKMLKENSCKQFDQRPNMLFTVEGKTYVNYYESLKYEQL